MNASRVNRRVSAAAAALLLLSALAVPAHAQPQRPITIDNFARVDGNYFRGAQPAGHDYTDLAAAGIKTVINLTSDDAQADESSMVVAAGMKYYQIPMTTHTAPTPEQLAQFLALVNDPQDQPVYVHCVGGSHRTGVMTAVYRMNNDQWSADRAFAEMKTFKFGPDFLHSEFKRFVFGYHVDPATSASAHAAVSTKASS